MNLPLDSASIIYLDNAATTFPKPKEVLEKAFDAYTRYGVNPGRSGYDLCLVAGDLVAGTRREMTGFFGGSDPNRLVFAANATDALNLLIQGTLDEGDHAVATTVEHNSVIRPLNHMARDRGVEVDFVPADAGGRVDPRAIARRLRPNTRLVIVNHGSNVIGTIQPVEEIGRLCRERGVTFAIDTAQTAGVVPIDMRAMCIDVVAFTGHKSLLAPTGIGGLCVGEGVDVRPTRFGGTGVNSAAPFHLEEYPHRLEAGTGNVLGIAGLHFGQEYIAKRGLEAIYRHEMELFARLQDGLAAILGVTLHGTTALDDRLPVLSFTVAGRDPADVGTLLDVEYNIAARTGLQCAPLIHKQMGTGERGTVRLSVGPLNTEDHIEAAIRAVSEIAAEARVS
ncbi:MAG TPA: aminotransferase class V-fold PLP-dependent enzyme [Thermoanaerobaculaceae bacterium]|nr:aminotransferase class V-fold PLP-dependent enzyme [Thermoanaerobaculaceae bacterium]